MVKKVSIGMKTSFLWRVFDESNTFFVKLDQLLFVAFSQKL